MVDREIEKLEKIKGNLLTKAISLRDELKQQEASGNSKSIEVELPPEIDSKDELKEENGPKNFSKLCQLTGYMLGVSFKDVNKKWLRDNVYCYTCQVSTKALKFQLDLTVDIKDQDSHEILNIECDFGENVLPEIQMWVKTICETKNFPHFISVISDYSEQSIKRKKLLHKLEKDKYIKWEISNSKDSGILMELHSPKNKDKVYFKIQWYLEYVEDIMVLEHTFTVAVKSAGKEIIQLSDNPIRRLCESQLTMDMISEAFLDLCQIINDIENNK